jgi:N-acetylmuramoyl-L-alanine amidase
MNATSRLKKKLGPIGLIVAALCLLSLLSDEVRSTAAGAENGAYHLLLDAGHGGLDPGATDSITVEKDLNLAIALALQGYLEGAGYLVTMTRVIDEGLYGPEDENKKQADMAERKRMMEESGADMFVSIHQNSYPDPQYWGPQVFYYRGSEEGEKLADCVQSRLNTFTSPGNQRTIKANDSYYILKHAPMAAAILVECGFITNSKESESLRSESYQKKVAWGIYTGIETYLQAAVN